MKSCSLCAAPLDPAATACARCGIAARSAPPARPGRARRVLAGVALLALVGGAVTAAAPAVSALRAGNRCEPQSWADWHLAMKRECLTPAYVCANMTSSKLFDDPQVGDAYRSAVQGGDAALAAHLEALVGQLRAAYGCEGPAQVHGRTPPRSPHLPPGHPPIGPGHPSVGGAPADPGGAMFQAPDVIDI
jgi:hypothetical protein